MFVDASALVAMLAGDEEGPSCLSCIDTDGDPIWSAMSCWETIRAVHKSRDVSFAAARDDVEAAASVLRLRLVEVGEDERRVALDAHETYGKGRHTAKLNMGDCFAYACAKTNGAKLLYKGNDFIHTDLA
ncbi:MAG: type II toxin-antitoxin system VapC family toxin [Pseudomonadota bacterium]